MQIKKHKSGFIFQRVLQAIQEKRKISTYLNSHFKQGIEKMLQAELDEKLGSFLHQAQDNSYQTQEGGVGL